MCRQLVCLERHRDVVLRNVSLVALCVCGQSIAASVIVSSQLAGGHFGACPDEQCTPRLLAIYETESLVIDARNAARKFSIGYERGI